MQSGGAPGARRSWAVEAGRASATFGRNGRDLLGFGVDDEVVVAHRLVADGELEEAVEDHAAAVRPAPVEAEGELVEVALQVAFVR